MAAQLRDSIAAVLQVGSESLPPCTHLKQSITLLAQPGGTLLRVSVVRAARQLP